MMTFNFTKMHGLGNDFMVIDGVNQSIVLTPEDIRILSQRETGVGFDQCLIIEPSKRPGIDFIYKIYNANGESVGQCGNGARCIARFIQHYKLSDKKTLTVATSTTQMTLILNQDNTVTVNFGKPNWSPQYIPLQFPKQQTTYTIPIDSGPIEIHALSIGNPHAVLYLKDNLQHAPVLSQGRAICEHALFPEQTNVGFAYTISSNHIQLRVYERGCGETLACGSGAVAATAVGRKFYHLDSKVQVDLPGGSLWVEWPDLNGPIYLTGPAHFIFEGKLCF